MISHVLEALAVTVIMSSLTVCGLLVFERGRAFLRRLGRVIVRDPVDAVIVFAFMTVLVAVGGSKPTPPPVVLDRGIKLVKCVQTPQQVYFEWLPDDSRLDSNSVYQVQEWVPDFGWYTISETRDLHYEHRKFTIEKYRKYRIAVDVTPHGEVAP